MDETTLDAQPPVTYSDFYVTFRSRTPCEKAAIIWRMPKGSVLVAESGKTDARDDRLPLLYDPIA
jgi:hypothetical protein